MVKCKGGVKNILGSIVQYSIIQCGIHNYWVECSRSIKLTALLPNSPIKLTALLS